MEICDGKEPGTMKVLLCTKSFPPEIGGSAFLIHELVQHWAADKLCVVHGVNNVNNVSNISHSFTNKKVVLGGSRWLTIKVQRRKPSWLIPMVKKTVISMIRKFKPDVVYLHYPNASFLIAGYLAAKELGVPYVVYMDILWDHNGSKNEEYLSSVYENRIVAEAKSHYAITEFAADYLSKKHGKKFKVIPHTLNPKDIQTRSGKVKLGSPPYKIHLAGGVNRMMNADAIFRFHDVLKLTGLPYEMEICTLSIPDSLANDPNIKLRYYSKSELIESQKNADLLLLPQAFEEANPTMIRNNLPTKTMEYLCSGSPILVFSPKDSYLSWLARENGFALVIDQPDTQMLAEGIKSILTDVNLISNITTASKKFAMTRSSDTWASELWNDLGKVVQDI